ncbi:hypothetical protein [Emticicia sp.]|uniref:hypothetical protein n=1 Tax=Emticicia sp. TaxID=1930953 RepID=UPI003750F525
MDSFYVYCHIDIETNTPFYIGKGQKSRAFSINRHSHWTSFVTKFCNNYSVNFIAENVDENTALLIEGEFIEKYGKLHNNTGCLLNWFDGEYHLRSIKYSTVPNIKSSYNDYLTDFGKELFSYDRNLLNLTKINKFLNELVEENAALTRDKLISDITKTKTPKQSWIIPFYIDQKISRNGSFEIKTSNLNEIIDEIKKPIIFNNLPSRPYVDSVIHKLMIYFDLILQRHIWIEQNGLKISNENIKWYFYSEYRSSYIKILQVMNKGILLRPEFRSTNTKDFQIENIFDFEVMKQ